jgi:hypothetical protein
MLGEDWALRHLEIGDDGAEVAVGDGGEAHIFLPELASGRGTATRSGVVEGQTCCRQPHCRSILKLVISASCLPT